MSTYPVTLRFVDGTHVDLVLRGTVFDAAVTSDGVMAPAKINQGALTATAATAMAIRYMHCNFRRIASVNCDTALLDAVRKHEVIRNKLIWHTSYIDRSGQRVLVPVRNSPFVLQIIGWPT